MDINKMINDLDSYFENTPKEHFEKIWDDVKDFEANGPDVDTFLHNEDQDKYDMLVSSEEPTSYIPLSRIVSSSLSAKV